MLYFSPMNSINNVNPLTLPLYGMRLIEASAGTGKTYTIAILYLRLLLGLDEHGKCSRPLCVKNILVVTFTEAAIKEIRDRIRNNIHRMKLACINQQSDDPLLLSILNNINCLSQAIVYLSIAEKQMDEASIFTIHGFCQHVLKYSTVESSLLLQHTIIEDEFLLQKKVTTNFWRKYCYPLPVSIVRIIQQYWEGPEQLLKEILPYLHGDLPILFKCSYTINETITERHSCILMSINTLKNQWSQSTQIICQNIKTLFINNKIYNNKNIILWIDKINQWVKQPTDDYQIPKELKYFRKVTLESKLKTNITTPCLLFDLIENFFQQQYSLREFIFVLALKKIRYNLELEKQYQRKMGFDDLLNYLDVALKRKDGLTLANTIRMHHPVAMIDEFQDTDPQQYRIFSTLYKKQINCGLLLIGDPKQAIYSFRGADIFTYMYARTDIDSYYTLNINWRSSTSMVHAINYLFQSKLSFVFKNISYLPLDAAVCNNELKLIVNQKIQPALCIWMQPGTAVNSNEYQMFMANYCSMSIRNLLNMSYHGNAWLQGPNKKKHLVKASDITVIVRNHKEATLISDALARLNISAMYLSNHDSVFKTLEAKELLWILQAILTPEYDHKLQCALATSLLGINANIIYSLNNNEYCLEQYIHEFIEYRKFWKINGILAMLKKLITDYNITNKLLLNGYRNKLNNLLHMGELLQEISMQIKNEYALVRWLLLQINLPQSEVVNQQVKLDRDQNLVTIITIHKSKGLEFPLVFLPFAADFRIQKKSLFHDRQSYKVVLDLSNQSENLKLAEEERLAEDLRLLYVAITRAVYQCNIGLAPIVNRLTKNISTTDLHLSAIGYLIQQQQKLDVKSLYKKLKELELNSKNNIKICEVVPIPRKSLKDNLIPILHKYISNNISCKDNIWQITSYSDLQKYNDQQTSQFPLKLSYMHLTKKHKQQNNIELTPHTFIRGSSSGIFLHHLLELIDFTSSIDVNWISLQMKQYDIDQIWLPMLITWIKQIINTPLNTAGLSLSHLRRQDCKSELKFYLSIDNTIHSHKLDELCRYYDLLSFRCPPLKTPQIQGMLKGCIDLVFYWNNRYYLLDYKSNWLGQDNCAYTQQSIEYTMMYHRYELQYQLYTLALHRFLRQRLTTYDYQHDFGGIFYLFLRGMNGDKHTKGIYYSLPQTEFIMHLDKLFSNHKNIN